MIENVYRLSRTGVARHPYYISLLGIGLWSVEELCYFIIHNPALADDSLINPALTRWLVEEFHMNTTALAMEKGMKSGAPSGDILLPLLRDSGYLDATEVRLFVKQLQNMEAGGKSMLLAMKGDALLRNRKYGAAIRVYQEAEEHARRGDPAFLAQILHNRGVALMQLLNFEEACRVFRKAALLDETRERVKTALLSAGLSMPRERFFEEAGSIGGDRQLLEEVTGILDSIQAEPSLLPADIKSELKRIRRDYHREAGE